MDKAVLDPPRLRSEQRLRSGQLVMVGLYGFLTALGVAQVVWRADEDGRDVAWWVMSMLVLFLLASVVVLALRLLALSSWRRLPVERGERLLWGTFAERVLPTGGATHPGRFALSTTRLRYLPDPVSRLRGAEDEEWPVAALHDVRIRPVDARRRRRGGHWVMVDVDGGASITLMSAEAHLVADELFDALAVARPAARD